MRAKRLLQWGFSASSLVLITLLAKERVAHAEADAFGLGDGHSGAKTVSGVESVNTYGALLNDVATGGTSLTISPTIGGGGAFAANDLVLVWRATGVAASEAPSGNQTKRLNLAASLATTTSGNQPGLVGEFEFARVANVSAADGSGNRTITVTKPLLKAFTKLDSQVVRVPEYTTLDVPANATIAATAWQQIGQNVAPSNPDPNAPWAGGITIFLAQGAITNAGSIHANGRGFHGAVPVARLVTVGLPGLTCNENALDGTPAAGEAEKGEGVVQSQYRNNLGGKGNISMAGGGANCTEGGGGGGANLGNGGKGAGTALGLATGGFGGVGVDYDLTQRMTMGGGGGAGRYIAGILSTVSFGGFGGGVVYIRGGSMAGDGKLESTGANGESTGLAGLPTDVVSEGSGGGGAGGTIIVRLTGDADCSGIAGNGGDGGDAKVVGLGIFGSGGGGGGGRVFVQSSTRTQTCAVDTNPGQAGNGGSGGSQPGAPGSTQDPTSPGPFCFSDAQCTDPSAPICDVPSGTCHGCTGPFGGGSAQACTVANQPVCKATGDCQPCNGDFGTGATSTCQLTASPYCVASGGNAGECGKCTTNADCTTDPDQHGGPVCNVIAGNCGKACTQDADCKTSEWCAPEAAGGGRVCTPKTPNGQPVPNNPPDVTGECTPASGKKVCLSGVCEPDDDDCGLKNSTPCSAQPECRSNICFDADKKCGKPNSEPCGAPVECRSDICFPADKKCGNPNGEPCTTGDQCRSALCQDGECVGCASDNDCGVGRVCNQGIGACVAGCRPGVTDGGAGGCSNGLTCRLPDGGVDDAGGEVVGSCTPNVAGPVTIPADGGDIYAGLVEGGGCSCNSAFIAGDASPYALGGVALAVVAVVRRRDRKNRNKRS